ncbi:hypothetical protein [Spirosoma areae]
MSTAYLRRNQGLLSGQLSVFTYMLLGMPFVCFSLLLFAYVVNVPWMDDIDAFLSFILGYTNAQTVGDKLHWLLCPNNEHRILTAKLITLALYKLTGTVNFRWLAFAASAFLIGILYLFYRVFRSINLPVVAFIPVPFLVLQPQHYLTSLWAITGLQHLVAIFLTFGAMYGLASGSRNRFAGAMGIQVLASLSMSNGLFGWVAGAVVLAFQRQWIRLAGWLVLGVATIVFYFHDFPNGQGNESSVDFFLHYPYLVFFGFFTFSGGLFDVLPSAAIQWRSLPPTLAGVVLIATMLWLIWRMNRPLLRWKSTLPSVNRVSTALQKRRYFFTGCYAFLLVNAMVVAFLRPRFGYHVMLVSNYMIYSAIITALLYINLLSEYGNRSMPTRYLALGLLVSVSVWGFWYLARLPKVAFRKEVLLTSAFNQQHNETGLGASWGTTFANVSCQTMYEAVRRGIYVYPKTYITSYEQDLLTVRRLAPDSSLTLQLLRTDDVYTTETEYNALPTPVSQAAIVVQSNKSVYLFTSEVPFSLSAFYLHRPVRTLKAEVVAPMLPPGQYRVGILAPSGQGNALRISPQTLTVP